MLGLSVRRCLGNKRSRKKPSKRHANTLPQEGPINCKAPLHFLTSSSTVTAVQEDSSWNKCMHRSRLNQGRWNRRGGEGGGQPPPSPKWKAYFNNIYYCSNIIIRSMYNLVGVCLFD